MLFTSQMHIFLVKAQSNCKSFILKGDNSLSLSDLLLCYLHFIWCSWALF